MAINPLYILKQSIKKPQEPMITCLKSCSTNLNGVFIRFFLVILILLFSACSPASIPDPPTAHEPGQLTEMEDVYGTFYAYVPRTTPDEAEILVLVHGTPQEDETAEENAEYYVRSWIDFAEQHGYLLIAPAFNQQDFSSRRGDHAMSGYRGLFGREIGADEWVLRLVKAHKRLLEARINHSICMAILLGGNLQHDFWSHTLNL
jgi:hypothetical protein